MSPLPSDDAQASTSRNGYAASPSGGAIAGPSNAALLLNHQGDSSLGDAASIAAAAAQSRNMPKPKYPIEDLDLDPTTILDGRVRRAKHLTLPPLPKKPLPQKDLPVPEEHMDRTLMCWNVLNIFGYVDLFSSQTTRGDLWLMLPIYNDLVDKHFKYHLSPLMTL